MRTPQDLPDEAPTESYPVIALAAIKQVIGGGSYQRGEAYQRHGRVLSLQWDAARQRLDGHVRGSQDQTYLTTVWFDQTATGQLSVTQSICSCPIGGYCKHTAALLLDFRAAALKSYTTALIEAKAGLTSRSRVPGGGGKLDPPWKLALRSFVAVLPPPQTPHSPLDQAYTPLGLQFRLNGLPRSVSSADQLPRTFDVTLSVRPVKSNGKSWSGGRDVSWDPGSDFYYRGKTQFDPVAEDWLRSLGRASSQTTTSYYYASGSAWRELNEFVPGGLWTLLAQAERVGVELVGSAAHDSVRLVKQAELSADLRQTESGEWRLTRRAVFDGDAGPWDLVGAIGVSGLFGLRFDGSARHLVIGPTAAVLRPEDTALLSLPSITIPATDVPTFLSEFYPQLRRRLPLTSSDDSAALPEPARPRLIGQLTFVSPYQLNLDWQWDYAGLTQPLWSNWRDPNAIARAEDTEQSIIDQVERTIAAVPGFADFHLQPHHTIKAAAGLQAVDFTEQVLPLLADLPDVELVETGPRPSYRAIDDAPVITVSADSSDNHDWFDLGVSVTVEGRSVPFAPLFTAVAQGHDRLLLEDGSYLRVDSPALDRLRQLLDEARSLTDRQGPLRINRYQASLWEDLTEVADVVEQADAWRESVGSLLSLVADQARPAPVALPEGLTATLRPYQQHGYDWLSFLYHHRLGGVLADDMGLGKTVQALALMAQVVEQTPNQPPFLVLAPASVIGNWAAEAARFTPNLRLKLRPVTDAKADHKLAEVAQTADVIVTSYTIFRLDYAAFASCDWSGLFLDEAQFVKNPKTKTSEQARLLSAPFKLAITGTPMENNLVELWSLLAITAPGLYPSAGRFREDYIKPITAAGKARHQVTSTAEDEADRLAEIDAGRQRLTQLQRRLKPLLLRRTKEQVTPELPPRLEQILEVELVPRHRHLYDTFLQRERSRLLGLLDDYQSNRFLIFRSLTLLRRMALDASLIDDQYAHVPSAKLDTLFEQLTEIIAGGHRALVFSQFTTFLKKAAARCDQHQIAYSYLDGSTRRRTQVIDQFKQGDNPVFLISLKAGGFGLNLTEADYVFLLDPWWNPATENQAIDRTHRIGQDRTVMVMRLVSTGTIEEKVMALKERKAELFQALLNDDEGSFSTSLSADDIRSLLETD
ncbi:MAG: DEAD/DEAH box helicase [Propionibacteriaceae bacterium]|nr:DEAD/DEAH box helicase [Propionibacteriaceae bacterium]